MQRIDSHRIKETPGVIFDLYSRAMNKFKAGSINPIFDSGGEGYTVVIIPQPSTKDHDLWIYHFPHRETPVCKITKQGEYLTMATYNSSNGARYQVTESQITNLLSCLITAIEVRRDEVSIMETGLP